ncbi:hypothetical protein IMCC26134_15090 [Verrucomicrobia bacterium IMCC26134]|nr:hypothetical protein IMCC26134_15090 [Verrucomicrobia bacterium IMCC26134]
MNFIARARATEELLALLPTLGITLSADQTLAGAIQAHITSLAISPAPAAADHTAALATLSAELEQAGATINSTQVDLRAARANAESATAQLAAFTAALATAGVKLPAASEASYSATDISAALEARISTRAAEQLAATGCPPVTATAQSAAGGHKSATLTLTAFRALSNRERAAFSAAGGRCTD